MATDYEKEWPNLRVGWAQDKIAEWTADLEAKDLPTLKRKKLEHDIRLMTRALADWKSRK